VSRRNAAREAQTGLFIIAGVIAVIVALFLLTDPGNLRGRYYAYTVVPDAGGIRKGDPVQMRGVNIGRVRGFQIGGRGVVVRLELEGEYPVPRDSRVTMKSSGLLGGMTADILPGRSATQLAQGDTIPSVSAGAGLTDIATELSGRADTVLSRAELLLSPANIGHVGASTAQLEVLTTQLAGLAVEQRRELNGLMGSLRRASAGVEAATTRPELQRAIARTDSITRRVDAAAADLQGTVAALRQTTTQLGTATTSLNSVLGRIDRGEGTLGKLTHDEALYRDLDAAAVSARQLTDDIRNNPKKYVNIRVF
jgi:phospholipid/cholesterol/gamma-HCH transport system substrate-binding protein